MKIDRQRSCLGHVLEQLRIHTVGRVGHLVQMLVCVREGG